MNIIFPSSVSQLSSQISGIKMFEQGSLNRLKEYQQITVGHYYNIIYT